MLRFAPSPTGDMHIGNLRAAIFNYIVAKQRGEKFLIRIEDTDSARNIKGADKEILAILNLFGLFWDKLVYQSENFPLHRKLAQNLIEKNKAFYCYATKDFLEQKRAEASAQKRAFRYKDEWAEICKSENGKPAIRLKGIAESSTDSAISQNLVNLKSCEAPENSPASWCKKSESKGAEVPPADFLLEAEKRGSPPKSEKAELFGNTIKKSWGERGGGCSPFCEKESELSGENSGKVAESTLDSADSLAMAKNKNFAQSISFFDAIKGECKFSANEIDSFVILREDTIPTYNFACAVDDMLYDISFIIRGEDHTSNTPKQMLIHRALGYDKAIEYAHLPIILNDEGRKMSKRESESSVKWLLSQGFLPRAIVNYLLLMGNNPPCEIFSLDEAIAWFDLSQLSKSPVRFDINQLRHINREHLKRLSEGEMGWLLIESNEKLKSIALNSSLGTPCGDLGNFEHCADSSPVLHSKSPKNSATSTANTGICDLDSANQAKIAESSLDSAISQNLNKNNPCEAPKTRPLRGAKNREQGRSSASADFLLEAEKRGSPPKSEKRQLFGNTIKKSWGERGGGCSPFCEKEKSEIDKNSVRVAETSVDSAILSQSGLPSRFCESARNDDSFLDSANRANITKALGAIGKIFLEEASTLNELNDKLNHIFAPKDLKNFEFGENARILRGEILRLLAESSTQSSAETFAESSTQSFAQSCPLNDFESLKSALSKNAPFKGKAFFMPLRFLLTGAQKGPHLDTLYPHLRPFLAQILKD